MPDIGVGQAVEAAAEHDAQRVASLHHVIGDVMRLVEHALVVIGEVGREHRITRRLSVDRDIGIAAGGHIQARRAQARRHGEGMSQ